MTARYPEFLASRVMMWMKAPQLRAERRSTMNIATSNIASPPVARLV